MKITILFFTIFLMHFSSIGQIHFDFGYQQNLLQKSTEFNDINSVNLHSSFAYEIDSKKPVYFGFNFDYFQAFDKLIYSNYYNGFLIGGNLGIRPLAKIWVKRLQPFFETNINFDFSDSTHTLKRIFNYGAGLEFYFTKKSAITITYYNEHYMFKEERLLNSSLKIGLRMVLITD
jgi:long-subunit fatty acid transport protein